jgi:hypothetical protein
LTKSMHTTMPIKRPKPIKKSSQALVISATLGSFDKFMKNRRASIMPKSQVIREDIFEVDHKIEEQKNSISSTSSHKKSDSISKLL